MHSNRKAWIAIALMAAFFATLSVGILIGRYLPEPTKKETQESNLKVAKVDEKAYNAATGESPKTENPGEVKYPEPIPENGGEEYYFQSHYQAERGTGEDKAYLMRFFTEFSENPMAVELFEKDYYSLFDLTQEDELFSAKLIAVGGEIDHLQILMDVVVKDEELAKQYETIQLEYYCLSPEVYENDRKHYGTEFCTGVKDPQQDNLFHCVLTGAQAWVAYEAEAVVAFKSVALNPYAESMSETVYYTPELSFTFVAPYEAYDNGVTASYPNHIALNIDSIDYQLNYSEFYVSGSHLLFYFKFADSELAKNSSRFSEVKKTLQKSLREALKEMYVLVDGRKIELDGTSVESYYFDTTEGDGVNSTGILWLQFEAVDFKNAQQLELHYGEQVINLKYCKYINY